MDQPSPSNDLRDRAASSEPCSTRPNPFEEEEVSSRKRRRTSLATSSPSRPNTTLNSPDPALDTFLPSGMPKAAMTTDDKSSEQDTRPRTPEHQILQGNSSPLATIPSRVTISIRNLGRPADVLPASPDSPSRDGTGQANSAEPGVKETMEEPIADMAPSDLGGSIASPVDTASPPIEIIPSHGEDDSDLEIVEPRFLIEHLDDPTDKFPYLDVSKTYVESVTHLLQYLGNADVLQGLNDWMESYLEWRVGASPALVFTSYQTHRQLWQIVPQILWTILDRKIAVGRPRALRQELARFFHSFSKLTAWFVEMDTRTLRLASESAESSPPDLASFGFLHALAHVTRRDDFNIHTAHLQSVDGDMGHPSEVSELVDAFQNCLPSQGRSLAYLQRLAQLEIEIMNQQPKVIESFGYITTLVSHILRENFQRMQEPNSSSRDASENVVGYFHRGSAFFRLMADALASVIDKQVTHLSVECATHTIQSLATILSLTIHVDRSDTVLKQVKEHQKLYPDILTPYVSEAMSLRWRLSVYVRLITSSQMQLRVMAVTSMATELVGLWKRFNDSYEEANPSMLQYLANYVLQTGLMTYIFGPTCHPEITMESGNIIGFLVVTKTYSNEHTDIFWQTATSTKDPRVSEALLRMVGRISNLQSPQGLLYMCEKMYTVPIEAFGPNMREFCAHVLHHLVIKLTHDRVHQDPASLAPLYALCVRLIKESCSRAGQAEAMSDLQTFAINKFKDLLSHGLPDRESRTSVYMDCLKDLKQLSSTTLGTLWTISLMSKAQFAREIQQLTAEFDFTRLLVNEVEAAVTAAGIDGTSAVLSGTLNSPRRELILGLILYAPDTLEHEVGARLWDLLVGSSSCSKDDRVAGWQIINTPLKRSRTDNPFITACLTVYLPALHSSLFCEGALDFIRDQLLPLVNDPSSIALDDDEDPDNASFGQLWRMILTAPDGTIEQHAIHTLVNDIYVGSRSILSFPQHRARKVHLGLVDRCLKQLAEAYRRLGAFSESTTSGDDGSMVIIPSEAQLQEQEMCFTRTLSVLRAFHRLHQARAQFAAPDLRSLIPDEDNLVIEGEPAELVYQCFDGRTQTDVKRLIIGRMNTGAALLASIRQGSGFDSYRLYHGGKAFIPQQADLCKSLEQLKIHNGLIIVKRDADIVTSPHRIRLGATPVEIEILSHFSELWSYLSLDEKMAREVFNFLIDLPIDDRTVEALQSKTPAYEQVFPLGEPFKALYALNAIRGHIAEQEGKGTLVENTLTNAFHLIVSALSDTQLTAACSPELQVQVSTELLDCFVFLLHHESLPTSAPAALEASLLGHLLQPLDLALKTEEPNAPIKPVSVAFQALLGACTRSRQLWGAFCQSEETAKVLERILLSDSRPAVRVQSSRLLADRATNPASSSLVSATEIRDFFWPVLVGLIEPACRQSSQSEEVFSLCITFYKQLRASDDPVLDLENLLGECSRLLLEYKSSEDISQPELVDLAAEGLTRLMHCLVCWDEYPMDQDLLPPSGYARQVFWRLLFPPFEDGEISAHPILNSNTRSMLIEILLALIKDDLRQGQMLLEDLDNLVPYHGDEEDDSESYSYELPPQFERAKAVRAPCGYVGLRNLSNTCYLNSLFTQLFMNTAFRKFMLGARVRDADNSQCLLFQTQNMFSHLQDSVRRFVDPTDCVAAIRTYEDAQIDIHNQMDVDEFYNLLFDRWEGQLLTSEAKSTFRSFFGGQLVQQVTSRECDHVSERLEPFSAIQCDIKGKTSLQESLQAYVDGEIMEGDNKYKCSTCDRHVDAVKRACLKDIPDNLIFHLKRFDFNLRTLQRSKINDFFSFPNRIDMRPYTIAHLSGPTEQLQEDVFELVGVLVHSGTAESGHYYSYIRERPTQQQSEVWVEFNDDTVSYWDPANLEGSCFGGPDQRQPFDANGIVYEKTYSAYMLFYQRSSTLKEQDAALKSSNATSPLKLRLSPDFADHIANENVSILRRHCLFDSGHISLVLGALESVKASAGGQCSQIHQLESLATNVALNHLDQVFSRAKDVPDFDKLYSYIDGMVHECLNCSIAFYKYLEGHRTPIRMLIQRNPEAVVRQDTADLIIRVLMILKERLPKHYTLSPEQLADSEDFERTIIGGALQLFAPLWENFHCNLRSWPEVFGFMLSFVQMGHDETLAFMETDHFRGLLLIVAADLTLELPQQYARMVQNVQRRMASRTPSYDSILSLLAFLLSKLRPQGRQRVPEFIERSDDRRFSQEGGFLPSEAEQRVLYLDWSKGGPNVFIEKLIGLDQNPEATIHILVALLQLTRSLEEKMFITLRYHISGQITGQAQAPFLRAARLFIRYSTRRDMIEALIEHVALQCNGLQNAEGQYFLSFLEAAFDTPRDGTGESASELELQGLQHLADWVPSLLGYYDDAVNTSTERFLSDKLFRHGVSPIFQDAQDAESQLQSPVKDDKDVSFDPGVTTTRSRAMDQAARDVGMACLHFLRDNYVARRVNIGSRLVAPLQRVITCCQKYFEVQDEHVQQAAVEFRALKQEILERLRRLVVDDALEEDASDWENSSFASDQPESVTDVEMQAGRD